MALEIERKFLVRPELLPHLQSGLNILQGYLSDEPSIRFRIVGEKVIITIKRLNKDGSRFELETEKSGVSIDEQEDLKSLARYPVIEKIRYRIPYFDLIWEVDVYQGENLGLITVDVELPSLNYPIKFPEWVNLEAEITTNPRYFNWNLGQFPYSKWVN